MRKHTVTEVVAYKLKNVSDIGAIRSILGKDHHKGWTDKTYSVFAKGSYISDIIRKHKLLTKYYTPLTTKYDNISFSVAMVEQRVGEVFTNSFSEIHDTKREFRLIDPDGSINPRSREFYLAVRALKNAKETIGEILSTYVR